MKKLQEIEKPIDASPTKAFFVDMLTRDIDLDDAILDLLDNCVDGIQRHSNMNAKEQSPYKGYWAEISFDSDEFCIEDNCGGIPLDVARRYAFKMGRPPVAEGEPPIDDGYFVIGTYGIGMKRAVFKLGREIEITSQTKSERFVVRISNDWLEDSGETKWELPLEILPRDKKLPNGTTIRVRNLRPGASALLEKENFADDLRARVASNYSYIMTKGFEVKVNDISVQKKPFELLWDKNDGKGPKIEPYIFEATVGSVSISIYVGFYKPLPSLEEQESDTKGASKYSSEKAGWTIICNDRVVELCDKTSLTGWGDGGAPRYHPQFNSIAGVVEFKSQHPRDLPLRTTKRGIEASSDVYLFARRYMIEGLKIFTSHTYAWKKNIEEAKKSISEMESVEPRTERLERLQDAPWRTVRSSLAKDAKRYVPELPKPKLGTPEDPSIEIRFRRSKQDVRLIAENLLEDPDAAANDVGEACFDSVLERYAK